MSLASGAHPTATFPCNHLAHPGAAGQAAGAPGSQEAKWSAPQSGSPVDELRQALHDEDWKSHFSAGLTKSEVSASWAANAERCSILQCIASLRKATRVLEVGGFCGVAALALAEKLPDDGQVVSLEYDQFLADFGQRHIMKSTSGSKISTVVGLAQESLEELAKQAKSGERGPFDMVIIDADKAGMKEYFNIIVNSPGFLSPQSVVCVDITPFKGQPPQRFIRFGQADQWKVESGQEEIDEMRKLLTMSSEFTCNEFGGLLVAQPVSQ
eukprot:TRINITY_DN8191_c0_g1_i1.p1 TRINITY_DN8191_c0_g1~~TRINITY_DN8191_c0_g1_i1.p1  ORF type:complete len:269 (-),score=55.13 TRINITY_DN8191_c0_g1_i1:185-991(-)